MRRVQKCAACGFPVSEGRVFCIDCERDRKDFEKQQREKEQGKIEQEKVKQGEGDMPVSYTHLDVYKRQLPLLLGLLVDTSGSVHDRFSFEKHAAAQFVQKVLSSSSDLGFIAGFAGEPTVCLLYTSRCV